MKSFKVGSKSDASKLAGAISCTINEGETLKLECIGAGATSVAVKGVAIARGFLASSGINLLIEPYFKDIDINGEDRTAIILNIIRTGEGE